MASQEQSGINSFVSALESSGAIIQTPTGGFAINPAVPAIANFVDSLPSSLLQSSETGGGDDDADNINFNSLISGAIQDAVTGAIGATPGLGIDYNGSYYSLSSYGEFSYGSYSTLSNGLTLESGTSFGTSHMPIGPESLPLSFEYELSNGDYQGFSPGVGVFYGVDSSQSKLADGAEIYNQSQTPGINTNDLSGGLHAVFSGTPHISIPHISIPPVTSIPPETLSLPFG